MNAIVRKMTPNWIKTFANDIIWKQRQKTSSNRTLPDFIIVGAQKAGTSSLYNYLSQHPELIPSYRKEVHFFDGGLNPDVDNFSKGEYWYRAHFPLERNTHNKKTFEATPLYIYNPLAPQRIAELIPEVKLILLLRNPAERAISHYFHEKRRNHESLPIIEALQAEEERLKYIIDNQDYKNFAFIHHTYKSRGLYYDQIKRYLNYFPMSNILLINSETLFMQPTVTLKRVFKFAGVDPEFTIDNLKPRNVASNRTNVDPDAYKYLEDYFRPHNQALYELIDENYNW